jgi:hypothetical protein
MHRTATVKRHSTLAARALKASCRRLGSGFSAGAAAIVAPATPWVCAWAEFTPEMLIAATALAQAALLVIWAQRCHCLWEQAPQDAAGDVSDGLHKLHCCP